MDQLPIPNRQRRRSNLGRRHRTGENPPRQMPVFQVPVARGLGRSHFSDKKTHSRANVPKPSVENLCAKKRLFLMSPLSSTILQVGTSKALQESQKYSQKHSSNISLNETGVQLLMKSPSPNAKDRTIYNLTSENSFISEEIQMPKSPGISHYNKFIFTEFSDLKRPVDPDDNIDIGKSQPHENLKSQSYEGVKSQSHENDMSPSPTKFNDTLDTTSSFLLAEQTIIDQTLIESPQFKKPVSVSKAVLSSSKPLERVIEEVDSDSEDELLQQTLSKLNKMSLEIEKTKKIVQTLIKKNIKRRTTNENKENDTSASNKPVRGKWMSELKSENPGLLKTPKPLKNQRLSLAEQTIWTPHSLSSVLSDQMDDLFE